MKTPISTPQMKYVIQCFISDKKGVWVHILDYSQEQLSEAFAAACNWYGDVLPCPDNGRYEDYTK